MQVDQILQRYRSPFTGKSSPVQFFWGSFDLNETRYSGKPATPPEGVPKFVRLSENQENIACGFWPGNVTMSGVTLGEPAFYSYTYPEPIGLKQASIRPSSAHYDDRLGEFILPYKDARAAASPEQTTLDFSRARTRLGQRLLIGTATSWKAMLELLRSSRPPRRAAVKRLRKALPLHRRGPAGPSGG